MEVKQYLDYLDKEMTIMGILSAAAVAAPAGILNLSLSKDVQEILWRPSHYFLVLGATLCIFAALLFYKQRSTLAWYYGQICLAEAITQKQACSGKLREWLRDADSWETWWPYCCGFTCFIAGFAEFLFALFFLLVPANWTLLHDHLRTTKYLAFWAAPLAILIIMPIQRFVRVRYKYSDDAWSDFRSHLFRYWARKPTPPHHGVYTRLKSSHTHGIGVFAITDIPEGTYVFEPDDTETVTISKSIAEQSDPPFSKLYRDFCVLSGEDYICPSSFNQLSVSWYLNHSAEPNVAADRSLKFYALREIQSGEELTADYRTYAEGDLGF
jgi:uncharacterized protein